MKLKTRKSAFKRVKIKKNHFARKKAFKSHLMSHKNSKKVRHLSLHSKINRADESTFYSMIPYI